MKTNEDLYKVLNIEGSATQGEIRKAYHKLAKQYHPDKHPGNPIEATIIFQKIKSAYTTLADSNKREFYDLFESVNAHEQETTSYRDIFSNIHDLMRNIQSESRDADKKLSEMLLSMKRPRSPVSEDESSSSYDEEKALAWLHED